MSSVTGILNTEYIGPAVQAGRVRAASDLSASEDGPARPLALPPVQ
jgi:hypothetical protein